MTAAKATDRHHGKAPVLYRAKALYGLRHNLRPPQHELSARFVILSQSRSGSSLLAELLDAHPEVHCATEIYRLGPLFPHAHRHALEHRSPAPVFGFKLQVHHLDNEMGLDDAQSEAFVARLADEGYRFIYLKRENSLRQVISDRLRRAGGPTYLRSSERPSFGPLSVDIEAVLARLKIRQHYWEVAERLLAKTEHVTVRYEADLQDGSNHQATADRLFAFLEIDSAPVTTSLRRINVHPLSRLVENYEELAAALAGTPWEAQLAGEAGDVPTVTTGTTAGTTTGTTTGATT